MARGFLQSVMSLMAICCTLFVDVITAQSDPGSYWPYYKGTGVITLLIILIIIRCCLQKRKPADPNPTYLKSPYPGKIYSSRMSLQNDMNNKESTSAPPEEAKAHTSPSGDSSTLSKF